MKLRNIFPAIALSAMLLTSCDDQIMKWYKDPTHGEISSKELPLALAEKISRYKELNTYTNFVLGIGIDLTMYMENETYRNVINANFDQITIGYDMKHAAMVSSTGVINYAKVDALLAKLAEAGITVYGHTLVWHSNQNASYLNGLIAPTVIPGSSGTNILTNGDFESGAWGSWGGGKSSVSLTTDAKIDGASSLKIVTNASSTNLWSLQVESPSVTIIPGHQYEISFFVKSDGAGKVRLSFGDATQMSSQYPSLKTEGEAASTSTTWKQVTYSTSTIYSASGTDKFTAVGSSMKFHLDFGKVPNMTYYLDHVTVVDLDAAPANLITNGDFETGSLTGWSGWGNSSTRAVSTQGNGYGGTGYAMVLTNPTAAQYYSAQQVYTLSAALVQGASYNLTFMIKANTAADLQVETQNASYAGDYYGGISVGTSWTQVQKTITPSTADKTKLVFDFGKTACTYSIDNIVLTKNTAASVKRRKATAAIYIEKTDAEKTQIIGDAMTAWISGMMTHYKGQVKAWDVVNEPMNEDGTLRDGSAATTATDVFYWVKYLGKDYAVKAFKLARQYGNADDKLFINDYNLESNLSKCDGLIDYVKYIETQQTTVDGIGTQMHISISTDTLKIDQMFQKLAASGKLIKVSELDVQVKTATPTKENYAAQAKMYKYVVDSYKKYVPEAQRYGITVWAVSDNAKEHTNWLPNDAPCLWDKDYARKHAYKGFADGLAGEDVSLGFSGELQY